jgi:hypothetical protein
MHRFIPCCLVLLLLAGSRALAQEGGSTIIPKREVNEVLLRGLDNLAGGGAVSDIVVRHLDVGDENMGVSVVQRSKVEVRDTITGIAHPDLDEIYYIVSGTGTMVTGGEFVDKQSNVSHHGAGAGDDVVDLVQVRMGNTGDGVPHLHLAPLHHRDTHILVAHIQVPDHDVADGTATGQIVQTPQ